MSENIINKKLWQAPWGYPESFAIVSGTVIIGLLLQIVVGSFDFYLLLSPVNIILGGLLSVICLILGLSKNSIARLFSSVHLCIALICALLLLTIIMGTIPQTNTQSTTLGFESMTSCWAFVLIYTMILISLGSLIVKRMRRFKTKDIPFHLNHLGLWLTLGFSALGYSDIERYIMYVNEGETQWRVYDAEHNIKELPLAITLNDFSMDFYPSREIIVDTHSGEIQKGKAEDFPLGERYRRIMSSPEPSAFRSDVLVHSQWGVSKEAIIEVNKPLRMGSWLIYQYGYDNTAGNRSSYSSFELVYDGWLIPIYIGIAMMMLGCLSMIWQGNKKQSKR